VQFFVFKINAKFKLNPYKAMILKQLDDFYNQVNWNEIKVVRTLHSVTLQVELNHTVREEKLPPVVVNREENDCANEDCSSSIIISETDSVRDIECQSQNDYEEVEMIAEDFQCCKCDKIELNNSQLEIHEFTHSLMGGEIEQEVRSNQMSDDRWKCSMCLKEFDSSNLLTRHLLMFHAYELWTGINKVFNVMSEMIDFSMINTYMFYIGEQLIAADIDMPFEARQYFYEFYSTFKENEEEVMVQDSDCVDHLSDVPSENETFECYTKEIELPERIPDDRAWIREEISCRREIVETESGGTKFIYRCGMCNYSTATAPGFRYHLAHKHLQEKPKSGDFQEPAQVKSKVARSDKIPKNSCLKCNLKFKDTRSCTAHQQIHELFEVVSNFTSFPCCPTCNLMFANESTLNEHLMKHENNEDIREAIAVPSGAVVMQGKPMNSKNQLDEDCSESDFEFGWSCAHCANKKFSKESQCRLHILMSHANSFVCPIDRMEFSGFKSVSLFSHHLRNKHAQLFPSMTFACTFCQTEFTSVFDKLAHMKNCAEKKFACDHCSRRYFKKKELVTHLRFVSGEVVFPCVYTNCTKKCETASDLAIHIRSHTKEVTNMMDYGLESIETNIDSRSRNLTPARNVKRPSALSLPGALIWKVTVPR